MTKNNKDDIRGRKWPFLIDKRNLQLYLQPRNQEKCNAKIFMQGSAVLSSFCYMAWCESIEVWMTIHWRTFHTSWQKKTSFTGYSLSDQQNILTIMWLACQ